MAEEDAEQTYLWQRRYDIQYDVELTALYHRKRERFLDVWDKSIKAVAILGSSAAISTLLPPVGVQIAGATVAVSTTLSLVFGLSEKARRHSDLAAQFIALDAEIAGKGERDFEEPDLNHWEGRKREIEASEPPALGGLVRLCQNQMAKARGQWDKVYPLSWYQWITAQFFDLPGGPSQKAT